MPSEISIEELIAQGFTLELSRLPDTPLAAEDELVLTDIRSGQILVARAPIAVSGRNEAVGRS